MESNVPELIFASRGEFRKWLEINAETHGGVWLIFGKTKTVVTLSANEALEEALCFGWIDGLMKSVDSTKYIKYFAPRRAKSPWSDKNKKIIDTLRKNNLMTGLGEKAIDAAKNNGMWDNSPSGAVTDDQINDFAKKIAITSPDALNAFERLPRSAKAANIRWYLSVKNEEKRQRNFESIIENLTKNHKP